MKFHISIAKTDDVPEIMTFIGRYWREGHILSQNRSIFEFQYLNTMKPDLLNMVIGKNVEGKIKAILGYIPTKYHDINYDVFGALWKVADDVKAPMLGLKLLNFLRKHTQGCYLTLGLNETSSTIYQLMNFEVGYMEHWYLANVCCSKNKLTKKILYPLDGELNDTFSVRIVEPSNDFFSILEQSINHPRKDRDYIQHRFIDHPQYQYEFVGIYHESKMVACLVIREQESQGSRCLRGVDFFGEDYFLSGCTVGLQELLVERDAEYIDLIAHGLDNEILMSGGFKLPNETAIIPNYFEPFVLGNTRIMFAYEKVTGQHMRIFKGDGDQDRPNII